MGSTAGSTQCPLDYLRAHSHAPHYTMITSDACLQLCNVYHSGQVEPGTCLQRLMGSVRTGVILKDVTMEVHGGEVMAVLGSKGSGKRALLEVVSRRAQGPTRGQVTLNGSPLTLRLFQERCGYVTHRCDLLEGLSVEQSLSYSAHLAMGPGLTRHVKRSRVRQVMADLTLTQVAQRTTEELTQSEYRRLMIGVQLVRDPMVLLVDEPTWELQPLHTYLVVSMLWSHARRHHRAVVLTMETPRSDVLPFLDRVTFLCLGDLLYSGVTADMAAYFRSLGFPCPELENPLMYYLCLSTVDRRSRERFLESTHQIAALVERFRVEGGGGGLPPEAALHPGAPLGTPLAATKLPLSAFGRPGALHVGLTLYLRCLATVLNLRPVGVSQLGLRLLAHPLFHLLLWLFYSGLQDYQHTFMTRNGLVFNCLAGAYFVSIVTTTCGFPAHRTRYYQEAQEGLYSGPLFVCSYLLFSVTFSVVSVLAASRITFQISGLHEASDWLLLAAVLWSCHVVAEHQTMAILLVVRGAFTAAVASVYVTAVGLVLASGALRSTSGLPDWLLYLTYGTHARYAGTSLARHLMALDALTSLPKDEVTNCSWAAAAPPTQGPWCRYQDGHAYLAERYHGYHGDHGDVLDINVNTGVALAMAIGGVGVLCLLSLVPLPAPIKAKFRD